MLNKTAAGSLKKMVRFWKVYFNRGVRYLDICPSWKCNLQCKFCGAWKRTPGGLSYNQIDVLSDYFRKINYLVIEGGEPFVYDGLNYLVSSFLVKSACKISIITNGFLVNKIDLFALNFSNQKERFVFNVSLNSASEAKHDAVRGDHSWRRAVRTADALKKRGFSVVFSCTPHFDSVAEHEELVCFANKRGIKVDVCFPSQSAKFGENGRLEDADIDFMYKGILARHADYYTGRDREIKKYLVECALERSLIPCDAGRHMMHIDPHGNIRPCHLEEDFILGHVYEKNLVMCNKPYKKGLLENIPKTCQYKSGILCNDCYVNFTVAHRLWRK